MTWRGFTRLFPFLLAAVLFYGCRTALPVAEQDAFSPRQVLLQQLRYGDSWRQVHAAEALLRVDNPPLAEIQQLFQKRYEASIPESPWRVGCLRMLYRTTTPKQQQDIALELFQIAGNNHATGQIHSLETIAKLGLTPPAEMLTQCREFADKPGMMGGYALGILAQSPNDSARATQELLRRVLDERDLTAAFSLRFIPRAFTQQESQALSRLATDTSQPPQLRIFVLWRLIQEGISRQEAGIILPGRTPQLLQALDGRLLEESDRPWLQELLADANPNHRIAAALALTMLSMPREQ